jgi:hypothetical protein
MLRPIRAIVYRHTLKKTFFRPNIDISRITGMMLSAVPTTIVATGSVDKLFEVASVFPTIPPTNNMNTLSDIKRARLIASIQTFFGS